MDMTTPTRAAGLAPLPHDIPLQPLRRPPTPDELERGEPAAAQPGYTARAAAQVSGLAQAFHRQFLAPGYKAAGAVGNSLQHAAVQAWSDSAANLPSGRTTLAAAGQTLQQMATCGAPTYVREVIFMHTYDVLAEGLAKKSPAAALTLQAAISVACVAAQVYLRQPRLERLGNDSSVAVRGHFALSEAKWNALLPDKQDALRQQMKRDSRNVTRNQIAAEAIYLGLGALGASRGDGALSARILATQLRNVIYAVARETMQASVSMTATHGTSKTHGIGQDDMAVLGWAYAAMTLSMGFVQDSVSPNVLPPGQTLSSPALLGADHQPLHGEVLAASIQSLAGTRAAFNTVVAILDNHLQKHFDTQQAGATQQFKPSLPLKDYGRVLDQSVGRVAWTSLASAVNMASGELLRGVLPRALAGFLGNASSAAVMGLAYRTTNQTFQAHASVRKALA